MYYEVNVSLNGKHLFATDKRSITTKHELEDIYKIFKEKFPQKDGYNIMVNRVDVVGTFIDMEYMEQE